mmetsp:Transcript_47722/g.120468  ORF Transcript_47722/g.120468 Transcript_47722/m.120468 type:complete len:344 (-) Transcript_47722:184-1215(-)
MELLCGALSACSSTLRDSALYRRCFPLREDVEIGGRRLQLLRLLGEGGYSFVYLARDLNDSEHPSFALKRIWAVTEEQLAAAKREVATIQKLQHRNLLHALDSALVPRTDTATGACGTEVYILFPVYHEGSLMDEMDRRTLAADPFSPAQVLDLFTQLCHAVAAMHCMTPALAHRDIKPQNVLLSRMRTTGLAEDRYNLALTDFGSTRLAVEEVVNRTMALRVQEDAEANCTAPYRAPELFDVPSDCVIDGRVNVWSLGCVLFYMMYGVSPFEHVLAEAGGSLQLAVMGGRLQWPAKPWREYPEELRTVVVKCLETNPAVRPDIHSVVMQLDDIRSRRSGSPP